jgi:hypothetical protein
MMVSRHKNIDKMPNIPRKSLPYNSLSSSTEGHFRRTLVKAKRNSQVEIEVNNNQKNHQHKKKSLKLKKDFSFEPKASGNVSQKDNEKPIDLMDGPELRKSIESI